jgi:LemA protein
VAPALTGCGYNDFQRLDEQVKAGWSEVLNQYQRRADLIPNIVATVKGEANFEQETLTKVVEARAKATVHPGHARAGQQPRGVQQVPAGAGRAGQRAEPPADGDRELPQPEGQPGLPGPARAAGRHREPHHRGAQPLHQDRAGVQRAGAQLPQQPDGHGVQLQPKPSFTVQNEAQISTPPQVDFNKK